MLTREQILAADDITTEDVNVPQWGGSVRVRGLTGVDRDAWEAEMADVQPSGNGKAKGNVAVTMKRDNIRAKLVARCIVNEAGTREFSDSDIEALGNKSAAALDRIFGVAMRLSGIGDNDVDKMAQEMVEGKGDGDSSS